MRGGELSTMTDLSAWAAGLWEFLLSGQRQRRGRGTSLHAAPTPSSPRQPAFPRLKCTSKEARVCSPTPTRPPATAICIRSQGQRPPRLPRTCRSPTRKAAAEREARGCGRGREKALPHSCSPAPASPGPRAGDLASALLRRLFFARTGSLLLSSLSEPARGCEPGHKGGLGRDLSAAE